MAEPGKSKYARANERAQAAGFTSAYAQRKARAQALGFSSPRTQRTASEKKRGTKRDYAVERENAERRARGRGFLNAKEQREYKKTGGTNPAKWQKARTLAYFGISESTLNRYRRLNRNWSNEYAMLQNTAINTYDRTRDADVHNWSPDRVGYILSFYGAIVNPKTNYDSLKDNPKWYPKSAIGRKIMTDTQYRYLVQYTNLFSVNEFEARYGYTK
jgi:hypothetical protein